jgi:hypothetical protein
MPRAKYASTKVKPLLSVNASWLIGLAPASAMWCQWRGETKINSGLHPIKFIFFALKFESDLHLIWSRL